MTDYIEQLNPHCGDLVMYMKSLYIYCGLAFLYEEAKFAHQMLRIVDMQICVYTGPQLNAQIIKQFNDSI